MVQLNFDNDDDKSKPIYTRAGWEIPLGKPRKFSQLDIERRAKELLRFKQNLILATVSNYPYNCVGLVFASRRAWIEPSHLTRILSDDGYVRIQRSSVNIGDIVVYHGARNVLSHVGIIVSIHEFGNSRTINVLSKWGYDAEFIHEERNVTDLLGQPSTYWRLGYENFQ